MKVAYYEPLFYDLITFRFRYREADTKLAEGCDDDCHLVNLCDMVTPFYGYNLHCEVLSEIFKNSTTT